MNRPFDFNCVIRNFKQRECPFVCIHIKRALFIYLNVEQVPNTFPFTVDLNENFVANFHADEIIRPGYCKESGEYYRFLPRAREPSRNL